MRHDNTARRGIPMDADRIARVGARILRNRARVDSRRLDTPSRIIGN